MFDRSIQRIELRPLNPEDPNDLTYAALFFGRLDDVMVERGITRAKSNLQAGLLPSMLCKASSGVLGTARNIIREALRIALKRDGYRITAQDIEDAIVTWAMPLQFLTKPLLAA